MSALENQVIVAIDTEYLCFFWNPTVLSFYCTNVFENP